MTEQKIELADIFRSLDASFVDSLPAAQRRVVQDIVDCRTAALGGHLEQCDQCGYQQIAYNSCVMGSNFLWGVECLKCLIPLTTQVFRLPIKIVVLSCYRAQANPGKSQGGPYVG